MTADPFDYGDAYRSEHDSYLQQHPEPKTLGFACPRCKAGVGEPCVWGRRPRHRGQFHLAREHRMTDAFNRRQLAAIEAGDRAVNAYLAGGAP